MLKLDTIDGLAKALSGLANHFKAMAGHHDAMHKAHTEMGAYAKAKHAAMADDDVNKAFMGKSADHHEAMAACHKAASDQCMGTHVSMGASEDDAAKAAAAATLAKAQADEAARIAAGGAPITTPTGVEDMIKQTTTGLVKKSLEVLNTDPDVANEIKRMVLEGVRNALNGEIVPDGAHRVFKQAPTGQRPTLLPRPGSADINKDDIPAELQDMVG